MTSYIDDLESQLLVMYREHPRTGIWQGHLIAVITFVIDWRFVLSNR